MQFVFWFVLSGVIAWILTKWTIDWANKNGFVDDPKRKHGAILHDKPIPRAGGIPVWGASAIVLAISYSLSGIFGQLSVVYNGVVPIHRVVALMVSGLILVIVGLLDDKWDLPPKLRLVMQIFCALLIVWAGVGVSFVSNPLGDGVIRLDRWFFQYDFLGQVRTFYWLANLIAVFWIVALMNMVNWSSGIDGQNAGISVVTLLVLAFAALREGVDSQTVALLAFVGAGAFAGFLYWSAYPQKIMPGFGGSTWSGFLIAVLSIMSGAKFATVAIVLAVPVIDSVWVGLRRIKKGKNPMHNDRTHLHHYLLDIGWSKTKVVWFYWGISAILGILVFVLSSFLKLLFFIGLLILFIILSVWLKLRLQSLKH